MIASAVLGVGVLCGLYGLFAVLYRGDADGNGNTHVSFGGQDIDARLAGAISLLLALLAIILASIVFMKQEDS
jgi:ABC-type Mn2+/Zn2+ transport system permease subunit